LYEAALGGDDAESGFGMDMDGGPQAFARSSGD